MNWDKLFQWYLSRGKFQKRNDTPLKTVEYSRTHLRPDLKEIKVLYNMRGHLNLGDVKPAGLLVQSRA